MPLTRVETKVTWAGGNNSIIIVPGSSQVSDQLSVDPTCVQARITLKADNVAGSPNASDIINMWLRETSGDPDGTGGDEYSTPNHGILLRALNTFNDDPAIGQAIFPIPQKGFQIYAEGIENATVNNITVSATITELRQS